MTEVIKCFECGELFERLNCEHGCEPDQKARLYNLWYLQVERAARRDDFAAAALTGMLACNDDPFHNGDGITPCKTMEENHRMGAKLAVGFADALLAELDKPQT